MIARKAAYLQIIRKCNNECVFCSNPQFEKEISLKQISQEIDYFSTQGITEIFLTGGEPTLHKKLFQIISMLRERNILPRLISNGVEFSKIAKVRAVHAAGLKNVHISFHSHVEKVSDKLSQKKGHYRKTLQGIRNLLKMGMEVRINCTLNELNYKQLPEYVHFMAAVFPVINHFVFNFLDPGMADGNIKSRAHENPWIVARYDQIKTPLREMVVQLKKHHKTFRIERVPLCCMSGFEEFSTETRKIVKDELYICSFVEKKSNNKIRIVNPKQLRIKVANCKKCSLNAICAGIQPEYRVIHGDKGILPSHKNIKSIIKRITTVEI